MKRDVNTIINFTKSMTLHESHSIAIVKVTIDTF